MTEKKNLSAILALFPDVNTLNGFLDDNDDSERINSILRFTVKSKIINKPEIGLLRAYIDKNSDKAKEVSSIKDISFSKLIEKRKHYLGIDDSIRNITKSINKFIESAGIFLPPVNHSMFTRLKNEKIDTVHKRDTIRCFSLWLGYNYPELIDQWNFRSMVQVAQKTPMEISLKEGVRVSFAIEGLGEDIGKEFEWLKKQINETISYLGLEHIKPKQIVSLFPAIYIDIHKKPGPSGNPGLYDQALRDAMALSHQISVKSSLHFDGGQDQILVIAIAAGEYLRLEPLIHALLSDRLEQKVMIRVSDFARLCARISDIKVVFYENEEKIKMPDGQTIYAWFIKCFWTTVYYDIVQELLDPQMLPDPMDHEAVESFASALYLQNRESNFKALQALYRSPHNDLLVMEIAKTLASKQLFQEANTVLSSILSNDPYHIAARCFRMLLFFNMALKQKKLHMFEEFFQRAVAENHFIMNLNNIVEPEAFCESGLVYLGGALQFFALLRNKNLQQNESISKNTLKNHYNKILILLKNSQDCFEKGTIVSPTGADNRCAYWLVYARAILKLIESNPEIMESSGQLKDKNNIFNSVGDDYFTFIGWRDERFSKEYFFSRFYEAIRKYQNVVLFKTYVPNVYYSVASIVFDFNPVLKVGILKLILNWLKTSKELSEKLKKDHSINFITNCFGQIIPADEFILPVENAITFIEGVAGNLLNEPDDVEVDMEIFGGVKLILLNFRGQNNLFFKASDE